MSSGMNLIHGTISCETTITHSEGLHLVSQVTVFRVLSDWDLSFESENGLLGQLEQGVINCGVVVEDSPLERVPVR